MNRLDRIVVVDLTPEYYGGLGNNLTYRNWNLDFLFQFVKQQWYSPHYYFSSPGVFSNQPTSVSNHYPEYSDSATVQQYTSGDNGDALYAQDYYTQSDKIIVDASYIRLKSMSLHYSLPSEWSKTFSGKVYLQGQNILTLTRYQGVDPETHSIYYLPPLRQFTLGIQLEF